MKINPNDFGVKSLVAARIPNQYGSFTLTLYETSDDKEHLSLTLGNVDNQKGVLVRVHSECLTGDVFGSLRCDCGGQLAKSMERIAVAGQGALIYMRQEGRGIGLLEKLRAYNLQQEGMDTVDANLALGHQNEMREYDITAGIIQSLGIRSIRLLTNNPDKIQKLQSLGIEVDERVALAPIINPENAAYIKTKVERMKHILSLF